MLFISERLEIHVVEFDESIYERVFVCDERALHSTFDRINIELTSLFYHIEC